MKGLLIAGAQSGSGKTTITLAMLAALKRRGLKVQSFKVGPDFIDPGHHESITGRPSHNLDGWMLPRSENIRIFNDNVKEADIAVVEGVMGLYDGYGGLTEDGSSAQTAKWLNLPVLLCIDARSMARSFGAIALGFINYDSGLAWAGILANRVGSAAHKRILAETMTGIDGAEFIGSLPRDERLTMPERHLGLVTADEFAFSQERINQLADWIEDNIDLTRLVESLPDYQCDPGSVQPASPDEPDEKHARIGIARDEAFCFYYRENLRRLEEAGAELVFFSPMRDAFLPDGLDAIYLGGGYPEVFAKRLSSNAGMLESIRNFDEAGGLIYAECGGFMYLTESLTDQNDQPWPMAGILPIKVRMLERLKSLGYREIETVTDTLIGPAGTVARGHEFHYSEICETGDDSTFSAYNVAGRGGKISDTIGYYKENILAGYIHLHFGSNPDLAGNLTALCLNKRRERI